MKRSVMQRLAGGLLVAAPLVAILVLSPLALQLSAGQVPTDEALALAPSDSVVIDLADDSDAMAEAPLVTLDDWSYTGHKPGHHVPPGQRKKPGSKHNPASPSDPGDDDGPGKGKGKGDDKGKGKGHDKGKGKGHGKGKGRGHDRD